ncbi:hypothetical protein A7M79_07145 [Acinetobacter baumannii]|uniref:ParM/StbA family protein n=1 Tax=Acinetobacter baumannii TaxID=470 RepID=UPI0008DC5E16|nr:ParM/StbA family protein [Acinetobacter baumannii]OIH08582.1 hypothetical protein A7M79_07145 [Acinetobacter baumannii]
MQNQDILVVGLDDGHDHQKVYLGINKLTNKPMQFKMPSKAAIGQANMGSEDEVNGEIISVKGSLYTVSPSLQNWEDTKTEEFPTSILSKVLAYQAIRNACKEHTIMGDKLIISSGLPVNRFYNIQTKEINKKLTEEKKANLLDFKGIFNKEDEKNKVKSLNITDHYVFCEGSSAYWDYIYDNNGGVSVEAEETGAYEGGAAIIDVGGRTTDCLIMNANGNNINGYRSDTKDFGVLNINEIIKNEMKEKFNIRFVNEVSLKKAYITGNYVIGQKSHDIRNIILAAKQEYYKNIENLLDKTIGDGSDVPVVILVGGGSYLLKDVLIERYGDSVVIPHDPEFANARGFYKLIVNDIL